MKMKQELGRLIATCILGVSLIGSVAYFNRSQTVASLENYPGDFKGEIDGKQIRLIRSNTRTTLDISNREGPLDFSESFFDYGNDGKVESHLTSTSRRNPDFVYVPRAPRYLDTKMTSSFDITSAEQAKYNNHLNKIAEFKRKK